MSGSAQPEDRFPTASTDGTAAATGRAVDTVGDDVNRSRVLAEAELDSALQLLVERAQYITGATGTALALPQGEEMVCRASAGSSAPAVGARLQVRSGLTGESISRRQLLRCDNAETDPRVNLEACRALGIASIVVLPLLRRDGQVRGLFEMFSDHPYAFEERDLIALERMADLTLTALDLAEQRQNFAPVAAPKQELRIDIPSPGASNLQPASTSLPSGFNIDPAIPIESPTFAPSAPEVVPSVNQAQKCSSCGFPVSEGRTLCLDCENKGDEKRTVETNQSDREQREIEQQRTEPSEILDRTDEASTIPATAEPEENIPAFLANAVPVKESWMTNHVNLLAIVVLILGILVAVVVFR
jgi:putative methionine-R-sulfoxide reductase with GAF domain